MAQLVSGNQRERDSGPARADARTRSPGCPVRQVGTYCRDLNCLVIEPEPVLVLRVDRT